jgi:ATP-dependent Clp protease, protease subunit
VNCIGFFSDVSFKSAHILFAELRVLLADRESRTRMLINSNGGDTNAGLMIYNLVRSMGANLEAHNVGRVDSAAVSIYLSAEVRLASPNSSFLIHRPCRIFHKDAKLFRPELLELASSLKADETQSINILAERTGLTKLKARSMLEKGTVLTAAEAERIGLVHHIVEVDVENAINLRIVET